MRTVPRYLKNYEQLYEKDPRQANLAWFREARYGMFLHYGLYSLVESREQETTFEWVQAKRKIPVAEYEKLMKQFTAERFDAEHIASLAAAGGMSYINLTTRHHDSFCLWDTRYTDFNSVKAPAGRDLVGELAEACERHGLGLFLYYSHGRDWRHPHAPNNEEWGGSARPKYEQPEPAYKYGDEHDLQIYVEFMHNQITELLEKYPTAAGIWLDGIAVPMSGDWSLFKVEELYAHIRSIHPHALISYKQGLTGTEDFFAPEHKIPDKAKESGEAQFRQKAGKMLDNPDKIIEICTTMIHSPPSWGYLSRAQHLSEEQVWEQLALTGSRPANLLLNTGPMPDGAIDPWDEEVFRKIGRRLRETGFPVAGQ